MALVSLVGCKKDPCEEANCATNEACVDGECIPIDLCANVTCAANEECQDGNCVVVIAPCDTVNCLNGGVCNNGLCDCPTGFEGDSCETALNDRYSGTFFLSASVCDSIALTSYNVELIPADTSNPVLFTLGGIYDNSLSNTVQCLVNLSDPLQFTIPSQSFVDDVFGSGFTIEGTGTLSNEGNTLTVSYEIYDVTFSTPWDSCTDVFIK